MYFCYFVFISLWKRAWPVIWTNLNSVHHNATYHNFLVKIGKVVLGKNMLTYVLSYSDRIKYILDALLGFFIKHATVCCQVIGIGLLMKKSWLKSVCTVFCRWICTAVSTKRLPQEIILLIICCWVANISVTTSSAFNSLFDSLRFRLRS